MSEEEIVELETVVEDEKPVNLEDKVKVLGLYDKPVIIEGSRQRKSVEFLTINREEKEETLGPDYSLGQGVRLGDVPIIEYNLDKARTDDLRGLHNILYRKRGKRFTIKRNIRSFCGWPFEKDSKEYNNIRINSVAKMNVVSLKWTLDLLAIGRSGKDSTGMKEALCEYLLKPCPNEKEIPQKKKKKTKSKSKKKAKKLRPENKSKEKEKKPESSAKPKDAKKIDDQKTNNSVVSKPSDSTDNSDSEEEKQKPRKTPTSSSNHSKNKVKKSSSKKAPREDKNQKSNSSSDVSEPSDSSDNSSDSEEEEEKPKKRPAPKSNHNKSKVKKSPIKKAPEEGRVTKDSSEDTPSSKRKRLDSDDSSDDDEPLSKMTKKPPTGAELKTLVSVILEGADLDHVTMKSVIKQVYANFPSFDLSTRKAVIKGYVKELLNS